MSDIEQTIPHRSPFLFIDDIVEIDGDRIVAAREIREEEPQFAGHYPGNPIMPGVLLCEATFQAAAYLLAKRLEAESGSGTEHLTPILSRILMTKFKNIVRPGDKITIEVTFKETLSNFHFLKGKITNQHGKLVLTNEFALALIEGK